MLLITSVLTIFTVMVQVDSNSTETNVSTSSPVPEYQTTTTVENISTTTSLAPSSASSTATLSSKITTNNASSVSPPGSVSHSPTASSVSTSAFNTATAETVTTLSAVTQETTASSVTSTTASTLTPTVSTTTNATTPQNPSSERTRPAAEVIVPAVVVPVVVLIILAIVIFCYRKRLGAQMRRLGLCGDDVPTDTGSETSLALPQYTSCIVPSDEFLTYLEEMQKESDFKYAEQFECLQLVGREQSTEHALLKSNLEKNRYVNIHPYDVTRVKLLPVECEEGSDYINASWIPGYYSKREYIAAQGPLHNTEDDMWRMIWEYNCKGIVMLTKCVEEGRKKCDQYWPEDKEPVVYGDIQVILLSELSEGDKWSIKKLELSLGQHKRIVRLLHFLQWPDKVIPSNIEILLNFMQVVKSELETMRNGPLVIHCSAGVGRTGTYIAIETLLQQLENENQVDVFGVVYRLRLNRVSMVQTESQYKFIHETVGHVIRKNQETLEETAPLNENDEALYANGSELIKLQEIKVDAEKLHGIDNPTFRLSSQT